MILNASGTMARWRSATTSGAALLFLVGCSETGQFALFQPASTNPETVTAADNAVKLVERDVEAPEVFELSDKGLWDGRPSLGGVWVAHADVTDPERVIIRNNANSKFVIGALFRRERTSNGPSLQVSSDAAAALGILAGSPADLSVTALRRESAPDPDGAPDTVIGVVGEAEGVDGLAVPDVVETSALDPVAGAAAAIAAAEIGSAQSADASSTEISPAVATEPAPAITPASVPAASSSLDKPFIQIGIFSVEENAQNTAVAMRQAGMVPTVLEQSSQGKQFWRVIVGPAQTGAERKTLLQQINSVGFDDAYAVTN